MTKRIWLWGIGGLSLLLILFVFMQTEWEQRKNPFTCELFEIKEGWGYSIYRADRIIIHQPYMPCRAGSIPFPSKETAEEAGKLVLSKLQNNEVPAVSSEELELILIHK